MTTNPFRFGALARDEAFADRADELDELLRDARNGQDVVLIAPRRFGKTSLVDRAAQRLTTEKVLVGSVNLMRTPTKERFAAALAAVVHDAFAGPADRAKDFVRGLRIAPTITLDPQDGSVAFTFGAGHRPEDVDATLERLLELIAEGAADRGRRGVLILDEFQEVMELDPGLPKLLRSVFQEQGEVAHIYLSSKRHMMERIFNDANEPFWRSAKAMQLGPIPAAPFADFIAQRFRDTGRAVTATDIARVLAVTGGHPYATQELCYFLWEAGDLDTALADVLRAEHAHFSLLWDRAAAAQKVVLQALAREAGHPLSSAYRTRHPLPPIPTTQKALEALARDELIARDRGHARISEPFLAEWVRREAS